MEALLRVWDDTAKYLGLNSFQMVVVFGMLGAGMFAQWQFQHGHHHHSHDD
jgi:hypothetical protein